MIMAEEFKEFRDSHKTLTSAQALRKFCEIKKLQPSIETQCPESEDPSWEVTFLDGSVAYITNPYQLYFPSVILTFSFDYTKIDWQRTRRRIEDRLRKDGKFLESVAELFVTQFGGEPALSKESRNLL